MEDVKKIFKERFHDLRKKRGLTQEKIIEILQDNQVGCNKKTFKSWEDGKELPNIKQGLVLADCLGCSLSYLIGEYNGCDKGEAADVASSFTGLDLEHVKELNELWNDTFYNHNPKSAQAVYALKYLLSVPAYFFMFLIDIFQIMESEERKKSLDKEMNKEQNRQYRYKAGINAEHINYSEKFLDFFYEKCNGKEEKEEITFNPSYRGFFLPDPSYFIKESADLIFMKDIAELHMILSDETYYEKFCKKNGVKP